MAAELRTNSVIAPIPEQPVIPPKDCRFIIVLKAIWQFLCMCGRSIPRGIGSCYDAIVNCLPIKDLNEKAKTAPKIVLMTPLPEPVPQKPVELFANLRTLPASGPNGEKGFQVFRDSSFTEQWPSTVVHNGSEYELVQWHESMSYTALYVIKN